ncbi:GOLPH3/VPS74 family protein [Streptomyces laculatispora]|uniref:GOLPH3/VPS74 family protein n=1 Tax=Streptomyces laculatispora TaxID=887464 RepID=UPI001A940D0E|nr:GPP34 family phosphoprotein [Streptomyces laculatispora]MBO0913004.1 GPP34 family phosphoprotein [Streptomyces laculatispora]
MTTAKDLFTIAMEPGLKHSVGQGDLSLALAGAELIDLIGAGAVTVDGDRIVPGEAAAPDDRLMGEAAEGLTRQAPYERIEDWLWRRGRDLSAAYQAALEEDGELTHKRSGRLSFGPERMEATDTPARRRAADRWEQQEPVLAALASVVGIDGERSDDESGFDDEPGFDDEAVTTVVAIVHDAVMELEAVRQRRSIENAAFANLWRGP